MMTLMMTIMMMMIIRKNKKKDAEAGMQVKQAAPRCDAVEVALMNDLLLGAIATSLATTVTLPPAEETPLPSSRGSQAAARLLEFLVGRLGFAWQSTRIIRIVPKRTLARS